MTSNHSGTFPYIHHDTYSSIDPTKADLAGKVVLVTGASKGIGKAIAIAFSQAGVYGLVLVARSHLAEVKAACEAAQRPNQHLRVLAMTADITDVAQVIHVMEKVKESFKKLDILINNAAFYGGLGLMHEQDLEVWWKTREVNMGGTYLVTRTFLPLLCECGGAKTIINMVSVGAHYVVPHGSAYLVL